MGRILIWFGLCLLVGGLYVVLALSPDTVRKSKDFDQVGSAFNGTLILPREEINKAIAEANLVANAVNDRGIESKSYAQLLLLFVVLFSAATAILAGVQNATKLGKRHEAALTIVVGLFGVLSAISTSSSGYLDGVANSRFACVDSIEEEAADTLRAVRGETDLQAARQYLDDLLRAASRCAA